MLPEPKSETSTKRGMNQERVDALGLSPLEQLLADIDALTDHDAVAGFFGTSNELGLDAPLNLGIDQDVKSPDKYVIITAQSGLGLPDRDYYFDESERGMELREKYQQYVTSMFELAGFAES